VHADKARVGLEAAYRTVLERGDGDRRRTSEAREAAKVAYLGGSNLAAYLSGREPDDVEARWKELVAPYQDLAAKIS
jgi:hypothetical protein